MHVSTRQRKVLLGALALCSILSTARAASLQYRVTNLTLSGGDPTFDVATDVTFQNLSLMELFADHTSSAVSLLDSNNSPQTSLTTSTIVLTSGIELQPDSLHGSIVGATITGSISQTGLSILTSFGGTPMSVSVLPTFAANLTDLSNTPTVNFYAINSQNGSQYALGTLDAITVNAASVPEPSTWAMMGLAALGLTAVYRRRTFLATGAAEGRGK